MRPLGCDESVHFVTSQMGKKKEENGQSGWNKQGNNIH